MPDLPKIYLCRHGQTEWNAQGRIQGQRDIALNALGRAQAKRNGRYLRNVLGSEAPGYRYVASPLDRACETMRIIRTEIGLEPDGFETDPRLVELHFGDWQGSTLEEIGLRDRRLLEARDADKWHYVPSGMSAESYERLASRVAPVFEALREPTIAVAHGGIARVFLQRFCAVPREEAAHISIPQDRILTVCGGKPVWV